MRSCRAIVLVLDSQSGRLGVNERAVETLHGDLRIVRSPPMPAICAFANKQDLDPLLAPAELQALAGHMPIVFGAAALGRGIATLRTHLDPVKPPSLAGLSTEALAHLDLSIAYLEMGSLVDSKAEMARARALAGTHPYFIYWEERLATDLPTRDE